MIQHVLAGVLFAGEAFLSVGPGEFVGECVVVHGHDDGITSVSLTHPGHMSEGRFRDWIGGVLAEQGQDLLRTKGILYFAEDDKRFAFQAVHMIADGDYVSPRKPDEARSSRIVLIG